MRTHLTDLFFGTLLKLLSGVIFLCAVAINFANVIGRGLFNAPIDWAGEVLAFMLIWAVMLCAGAVTYERGHLSMDIVLESLPSRIRAWINMLTAALIVSICAYAAWQSWAVAELMFRIDQTSVTADIPTGLYYTALVTGFTLIGLAITVRLIIAAASNVNGLDPSGGPV